jgi:hypothetical protein
VTSASGRASEVVVGFRRRGSAAEERPVGQPCRPKKISLFCGVKWLVP